MKDVEIERSAQVRWPDCFAEILVFLLVLYPLLIVLRKPGSGTVLITAADTFYYMAVDLRSQATNFFTFDRIYPTNGFHPFHQWMVAKLATDDPLHYFRNVIIMTGIVLSAGSDLLTYVISKNYRNFFIPLLSLVLGPLFFLFGNTSSDYFSIWSYMSAWSVLWVSCLFVVFKDSVDINSFDVQKTVCVGLLINLIIFARLDDVFIVASLFF